MNKVTTLAMVLVALAVTACQQAKESPSEANPDARPHDDAGSGPRSMGQGTSAQGMMGQGTMGHGAMGLGMRQTQAAPESGATGDSIFRSQCSQCHTLKASPSGLLGPTLYYLFGRKAGTVLGYAYSTPMRKSGVVWNDSTLNRYIAAPQSYVPGNVMPFPGIADKIVRERLVAYLKEATR